MNLQVKDSSSVARPEKPEEPEKPNFGQWKVQVFYWGLGLLSFIVVGYLLALAGISLTGPFYFISVTPVAEVARGQVIAAAVAWLAGVGGLITFHVNYHQKRYLQELQLHKDREIAEKQRTQERQQFEYDAIQKEFENLSDDFAHKDELPRINAGIGLANIAQKRDPRKPENAENNKENYPWYERAAMQLSAALHIYDEPETRAEVRKAIRVMAKFDVSNEQPLLHLLINHLADANRAAYIRFLDSLAEVMVHEKKDKEENLNLWNSDVLGDICRIHDKTTPNQEMLMRLQKTEKYKKFSEKWNVILMHREAINVVQQEQQGKKPEQLELPQLRAIKEFEIAMAQLIDTRDAIADCVKDEVRHKPKDMPTLPNDETMQVTLEQWREMGKSLLKWKPKQILNLEQTFLQGADLRGAQLQGADLTGAQLQGADLMWAQLQGADLMWAQLQRAYLMDAQLQGADLSEAQLQRAYLIRAQLQGAYLSEAQLQGAYLIRAQLQGAYLMDAQLQGADLIRAQLQGADLTWAQLQGAYLMDAQLQGADLRKAELHDTKIDGVVFEDIADGQNVRANFTDTNWKDADFRLYERNDETEQWEPTDEEDERLKTLLDEYFPYDREEKAVQEDLDEFQ